MRRRKRNRKNKTIALSIQKAAVNRGFCILTNDVKNAFANCCETIPVRRSRRVNAVARFWAVPKVISDCFRTGKSAASSGGAKIVGCELHFTRSASARGYNAPPCVSGAEK